jgi:hypothetical protein
MLLMVMMNLFHFDMVIPMNMVVDKHLYLVLVIVDSSLQHLQLDTVNIEEHIEVHYHYLMFYHTCHL